MVIFTFWLTLADPWLTAVLLLTHCRTFFFPTMTDYIEFNCDPCRTKIYLIVVNTVQELVYISVVSIDLDLKLTLSFYH